jgi:hypothetical protein
VRCEVGEEVSQCNLSLFRIRYYVVLPCISCYGYVPTVWCDACCSLQRRSGCRGRQTDPADSGLVSDPDPTPLFGRPPRTAISLFAGVQGGALLANALRDPTSCRAKYNALSDGSTPSEHRADALQCRPRSESGGIPRERCGPGSQGGDRPSVLGRYVFTSDFPIDLVRGRSCFWVGDGAVVAELSSGDPAAFCRTPSGATPLGTAPRPARNSPQRIANRTGMSAASRTRRHRPACPVASKTRLPR